MEENNLELFGKKIPFIMRMELIIVPITFITGSEVTNLSIAEIKSGDTKWCLQQMNYMPIIQY